MPEALAYFITWTTYGSWLPGDERGWVLRGRGFQTPNPRKLKQAQDRMTESLMTLNVKQRALVETTVKEHCKHRKWQLHAVKCRSNHVHVVVTAACKPEVARDQLKAWCTRKLKEQAAAINHPDAGRLKWWTERGSCRSIGDEVSLGAVILYVMVGQDRKGRDNTSPPRKQGRRES
jgi:REP element-mobilizing transposase RayT